MATFACGASRTVPEGGKVQEKKMVCEMLAFFTERLSTASVSEVAELVGHVRIKTHKKHDNQEQLCTSMWHFIPTRKYSETVNAWMQAPTIAEGGKRLHGRAPRGPLGRVISQFPEDKK
ncbi:unnamed protein product [Prorocentrum cordatum]|uniref:Uncharacterized protein n=1 Tax=Prorocentrum cordatum TaxID=2364126 RepID=A0ABN9PZ91_9DINO|nr:unnamed protein product [Polarella glacialis]